MSLLLLLPLASAFVLSGEAWPDDQLPLQIHWTGSMDGYTEAQLEALVVDAAAAWVGVAPCAVGIEVVHDPAAHEWFEAGGMTVLFGDPNGELGYGAPVAIFRGPPSELTFERNGNVYAEVAATEIVVAASGLWATDADIEAGNCHGQISLQALLTHELGHVLGLAHSCEETDACDDEAAAEATMYWGMEACDTSQSSPAADDIRGLSAIYGETFAFAFVCDPAADDGLTVDCAATEPADVGTLTPTWDFGDGTTAEGGEATHTYTSAGAYTVELCVSPPECGAPRCQSDLFVATGSEADTGGDSGGGDNGGEDNGGGDSGGDPADTGGEAKAEGCGCTTGGGGASVLGALVGLGALVRRRRG